MLLKSLLIWFKFFKSFHLIYAYKKSNAKYKVFLFLLKIPSLNFLEVFKEFDFPEFQIVSAAGFKLLVRAIRLLQPQLEPIPADVLFRQWNNSQGQVGASIS